MILRAMVLAAVAMAISADAARAQAVLDARDPAVTERPGITSSFRAPVYPLESNRRGEQGEVMINVCVDVSGNVVAGDMVKGSGYAALDQATVDWIQSGPKFKPASAGDKPVAVCNYIFTYLWTISGRRAEDPTKRYLAWKDVSRENRPSIAVQVNGPTYPPVALAKRIVGTVRLSLCISPYGRMVSADVVEGDEESGLAAATRNWMGRFIFSPGKQNGEPVGVCGFPVKYEWTLPG